MLTTSVSPLSLLLPDPILDLGDDGLELGVAARRVSVAVGLQRGLELCECGLKRRTHRRLPLRQ